MTQGPIEIRPTDLIQRPAEEEVAKRVGSKTSGPGGWLQQAKEMMQLIKDLNEMTGGKLTGIVGDKFKEPGQNVQIESKAIETNQAAGIQMFIRVMQMQYGDCTVNELIEKLRADFGDKKISQLARFGK